MGWLVVVARAVSRKTPIYFMFKIMSKIMHITTMTMVIGHILSTDDDVLQCSPMKVEA